MREAEENQIPVALEHVSPNRVAIVIE